MSDQEWSNASTDKKLQILRGDIINIYDALSRVASDTDATHRTVRVHAALLKAAAVEVEAIEKQLPRAAKGS
jgi:hypothetical protein